VPGAIQIVIPGIMGPELMQHTIESSRSAGAIVFNANYRRHDIYRVCHRHVFHVKPSPETIEAVRASATHAGTVELWSAALTRYGADTLNQQFRGQYARRMDSAIWAGWFAVRCAWESALASNAATADDIIAHIEKPGTTFDGNKGVPLFFDANHELVQPLYLADREVVNGEVAPIVARRAGPPVCR
jgi:hypothetical protein